MRALRRKEPGKPAAALAIIAGIFATALVIKLLPPATRQAVLLMAEPELPSRALVIWSANLPPVSAARTASTPSTLVAPSLPRRAQREGGTAIELTGEVAFTFDRNPGDAPALPAGAPMLVAYPAAIEALPTEIEVGSSLFVSPFTRTGSALRVAFVKTGSAIKAAASGTAGVFVSNP